MLFIALLLKSCSLSVDYILSQFECKIMFMYITEREVRVSFINTREQPPDAKASNTAQYLQSQDAHTQGIFVAITKELEH